MKQINKNIIIIFIYTLYIIFMCILYNIMQNKAPEFPGIKETTIKEMTGESESHMLESICFEQEKGIYKIKDIYGRTIDSFYGVFDYTLSGPIAGRICNKNIVKTESKDIEIIINITRIYYIIPNGNIEINPSEEK